MAHYRITLRSRSGKVKIEEVTPRRLFQDFISRYVSTLIEHEELAGSNPSPYAQALDSFSLLILLDTPYVGREEELASGELLPISIEEVAEPEAGQDLLEISVENLDKESPALSEPLEISVE